MWWFALLYLTNAVAPHRSVIYNDQFRFVVAGIPVNILDVLVFAGLGLTLLPYWQRDAWHVERVHPAWSRAMALLGAAFVIATIQSFIFYPDLPPRFRFPPIRNFVVMLACLYVGYRCFARPGQAKAAFWIIFWGSVGSALASIVNAGQTADVIATKSGAKFDLLRETALDVSGEAGLLALCAMVFSAIAGLRFLPSLAMLPMSLVCVGGLFFIPHRSSWLAAFVTCGYATLVLWPFNVGRKLIASTSLFVALVVVAVVFIGGFTLLTGRDFGSWVDQRLESLMPKVEAREGRAWDTRLGAMEWELRLYAGNPILGRGFAAQEGDAVREGRGESFRHTPWVSTLCELGPLGLAGFITVILGLAVVGTRMARQGPDQWFALLGAVGASWGVLCAVMGFMSLHWNSPRQAITLGLIAGVVFRARDLAVAVTRQAATYDETGLVNNEAGLRTSYV